jgi:hypothetical protein
MPMKNLINLQVIYVKGLRETSVLKRKYLYILINFIFPIILNSQLCSIEKLTLTNQAQIDNFKNLYCSHFKGDLTINGPDINDLQGLNGIISIDGDLRIHGLDILTNLQGFKFLRNVTGNIIITGNKNLIIISGFNHLDSISGSLTIYENKYLSEISGFNKLIKVGGYLALRDNLVKTLVGFSSLQIAGQFDIRGKHLNSFSGLHSLTTILKDLNLSSPVNSSITSLDGLNMLESIEGKLVIWNDNIKDLKGLENLRTIGNSLKIWKSKHLENLDGLSNLGEVGNSISIWENPSLNSISGLKNLKEIRATRLGFSTMSRWIREY